MRQIILATVIAAIFALPAFAQDAVGEAVWDEMVAETDHAYSERQRAILKIDDAIYMDAGQTAWLVQHSDEREHYLWTLEEPEDYVVSIANGGEEALMRHVIIREYERDDPRWTPPTFSDADNVPRLVDIRFEADMLIYHDDHESYEIAEGVELTAYPAQLSPGVTGLRATVFNENHPEAEHFEGLLWYDYNPDLVIEARFEALDEFVPETFQTSRGWYKEFQHVGNAHFSVDGVEFSMPLYGFTTEPAEVDAMSAFFTDAMSGIETYGVGRYLDVEIEAGSFPPATVTLDFNYAYNPLCARSSYYNCPYAEYDIPLPIRAGEMKPADH